MQTWKQTFYASDGTLLSGAAVNVYLAGTLVSARVFDTSGVLHDTAPQLYTDVEGFVEFSFDPDDFSTSQLFDVIVSGQNACYANDDVELKSLKLLQDTEGGLSFKSTYIQSAEPTGSTIREGDFWLDTDDNKMYVYTDGAWVLAVSGGSGGVSSGIIALYKRAATAPSVPSTTLTYTFSTGVLSGTLDGWTQSVPETDGNPCWITGAIALATSPDTTDDILAEEWDSPASKFVEDGIDGLNQGVIYLYQRSTSVPSLDMLDPLVYTFSTLELTGSLGTWALTIPSGTDPLYVIAVYVSSNTDTESIPLSRWSTPVIMAQNGTDGVDGVDGAGLVYRGSFTVGTYYYTDTRRDVVYYNEVYYLYNISTGTSGNYESAWASRDWTLFSDTFESVATKLLLAEDAAITKNLNVGGGTGANTAGMSGVGSSSSDIRIWAGSATKTSAPFRVTQAGALYASNATLSGTMTIGSGSSYTGNQISASYTAADVNTIDAGDGLAALDSDANTKLTGIESGAQVTSSVRINNALTSSTLAFSTSGKITFGTSTNMIYGTSTTMTLYVSSNQQINIANNKVTLSSNAGYISIKASSYVEIGSTGSNLYLGGDDVYLNPESSGEIIFKFGSTEQMYANSSGFYPTTTATSTAGKYLGYSTKRWYALYTYHTYDYDSSFDDTFDDLYEISQFTSRKKKVLDSETGKKVNSDESYINSKTGGEYLDLLSLPKRLTNYDQILVELLEGGYGLKFGTQMLMTKEEIIEALEDFEELGWLIARDSGAFSSLTNGALRAKLVEDSEMYEIFASRITALETENTELTEFIVSLMSRVAALEKENSSKTEIK